jgi:hypothetical protein
MDHTFTGPLVQRRGPFMHPSDDDLESYGRFRLRPEQESAVHSHILSCQPCREKALRPKSPAGGQGRGHSIERRKHIRTPLDAPVRLRPMDGSAPMIEGRIVNVSKNGFKLKLPHALQPGLTVQARIGGRIVMAEVRYSIPAGEEFHVGLEIQDVFPIPERSPGE